VLLIRRGKEMSYSHKYLFSVLVKVFESMGCSASDAEKVAEVLVRAELRGINSHGLIRVKDYYQLWKSGRINTEARIRVVHESPSTAVVDADSALGMIAGQKAMSLAIEKAKKCGSGWVSVRNSNHFGIAGFYASMALKHDMAGLAMTNANPLVAPTFSLDRLLGTNPIALAFPAGEEPDFIADFATTPIARGKLSIMQKQGIKVPIGYVQDSHGMSSNDPDILKQGGAIVPLGSDREHGCHKGYCLAASVDILSAIFSGAGFGPFVPPSVDYLPLPEEGHGKGTGHFFGAMRIDGFQTVESFKKRMDQWIRTFRAARPADGQEKVLIPGDPERESEENKKKNGITIIEKVKEEFAEVCKGLGVAFDEKN